MSNITSEIVTDGGILSSVSTNQTVNSFTDGGDVSIISQLENNNEVEVIQFSGIGVYTAGDGLILDANEFSVDDTIARVNNPTFTGTVGGITAQMVGLGSVDNTSDLDKPVSTATATALSGKQPVGNYATGGGTATGTNTGDQDLSGLVPKTTTVNGHPLSGNIIVTKSDVGLSAVDNTSDLDKPVSIATSTALGLKANIANPIFTGTVTLAADPTSALHAATKEYVDNLASGIVAKPSVLFATSNNLDATYTNGIDGVGAKLTSNVDGVFTGIGVDGITIGTGVLVKSQTSKAQNGRYFVSNLGSPSTRWVLTRCGLCDEADEIPGAYIFVQDGAFKGSGYVLVVADPPTFTVGIDNIDVFQFSGAGTYTAANGVVLNDNQFSADATIARLDGPTFTGIPSAPTAAADTNTTQIATTAYAKKEADDAQAAAVQRVNHTGTQDASTITGLSTVATSGSYTDLSNKPTPSDIDAADEVLVSATPPVSPLNQQRWFNTNSGVEYVWVASQNVWVGTVAADSQPVSPSAIGAVAPGDNTVFTGQLTAPLQTAATSYALITRDLGDARYGRIFGAALASGVNSDINTTTYKTVAELSFALDVGTYYIDCILIHNGNVNYASSGVKDRLNFTGTATSTGTLYRVLDNATTTTSVPNGLSSKNPTIESSPSNRSQTTWRKGVLTVTASGILQVQIAQTIAVAASNTTLDTGSQLIIYRIP